uniref:Uncharacterized protein n=1 Tax=viral metagenome TaxID=1070528 RepID=A0A6C0JZ69_9ZZZZ
MWWVLQSVIVSIIVITLLHYGWYYLKKTYSTPKTKDIAKIHAEKYDHILSEILEAKTKSSPEIQIDPEEMENDLAMFLEQTLSDPARENHNQIPAL